MKAGEVKKPKARRSFTGCYTCRKRKIKCDNARPTCQRCAKSNLQCLGYDIQLRWSKPLTISTANEFTELDTTDDVVEGEGSTKRRNIQFMKFKKNYKWDGKELDADLGFCNHENLARYNRDYVHKGPFSVFTGGYFGVRKKVPKPAVVQPPVAVVPRKEYSMMIRTNDSDLRSTYSSIAEIEEDEEEDEDEEYTIEVWIDKRFNMEARATLAFLTGSSPPAAEYSDTSKAIKVIFAKYFETTNEMMIDSLMNSYRYKPRSIPHIRDVVSIRDNAYHELIRVFIDNIHMMMPITFKGNIYETMICPLIYQFVGQVMITATDSFNLSIKHIILKQVLCIASFFKYEQSHMEKYLSVSVELREGILLDITALIIKLTDVQGNFILNKNMGELISTYEVKNIVLLFILMIKIDFFVQIVENFSRWFKLLDNLIEFLNDYNDSILNNLNFKNFNEKLTLDKFSNLKKLIKLYRVIKIFYFSTAKIDMDNYDLGTEAEHQFEDIVNENYNLTKGDFIFDDGFNKIDDFLDIAINKPDIIHAEDKPTFTIKFNNQIGSSDEEDDEDELESDDANEDANDDSGTDDDEIMQGIDEQTEAGKSGMNLIDIPEPDNDTIFIGDFEDDVNKLSSIEYMYGLPLSLLELFNKIITLTNHKNFFTRRKLFPRNYPKLCCDLEEDLMNWKLTWRLFDEKDQYKSAFHEILYHNILGFYNGLCLYFERIIKESDPSLLQNYVTSALKHLNKITEIKDANAKVSPLFWSYFISSCDAIEPELQLQFDQISSKFIGNNWISKQVILEAWKKRNREGMHQVCWLDIVKDWDCDVLLLC